jgi:hypothetical protein
MSAKNTFLPGGLVEVSGLIHVVLDADNTLCYTATSDAADSENDESLRWRPVNVRKPKINCKSCLDVIHICNFIHSDLL